MKEGYYITSDGIKHRIKSEQSLDLDNLDLIKLVIPDGVKYVSCNNNNLTELILPDGVKKVFCWDNKLLELIIPNSIELVSCENNNNLSELILPDGIKYVWCDNINIQDLDRFINEDVEIYIEL